MNEQTGPVPGKRETAHALDVDVWELTALMRAGFLPPASHGSGALSGFTDPWIAAARQKILSNPEEVKRILLRERPHSWRIVVEEEGNAGKYEQSPPPPPPAPEGASSENS